MGHRHRNRNKKFPFTRILPQSSYGDKKLTVVVTENPTGGKAINFEGES